MGFNAAAVNFWHLPTYHANSCLNKLIPSLIPRSQGILVIDNVYAPLH